MNQTEQSQNQKIGILGGTFDPIHNGHLMLANCAIRQFSLDEVRFIPAGNPPHKQERNQGATPNQRLEMVKLAVNSDRRFPVDPMEIERGGLSYTKDTLLDLKEREPDSIFYFIIGADSMISFDTWFDPLTICQNCILLVAGRNEVDEKILDSSIEKAKEMFRADIRLMDTPDVPVSSSTVRSLCQENQSIRGLVPDAVMDYINTNGLYRS